MSSIGATEFGKQQQQPQPQAPQPAEPHQAHQAAAQVDEDQRQQRIRRSERLKEKSSITYNLDELQHWHQETDYIFYTKSHHHHQQQQAGRRVRAKQPEERRQQQENHHHHRDARRKAEPTGDTTTRGAMLSKIKSAAAAEAAARGHHHANTFAGHAVGSRGSNSNSNSNNSDNEDLDGIDSSDSNNNNNDNSQQNNNNNNNSISNNNNNNNGQSAKKTQEELIDIVEVSRKRRLSKDSADSLTGFIRWSFSHVGGSHNQRPIKGEPYSKSSPIELVATTNDDNNNNNNNNSHELQLDDDDDDIDWSASQLVDQLRREKGAEHLLRHQKAALCGGSSAANLALLRSQELNSSIVSSSSFDHQGGLRASKRLKAHNALNSSNSSSSSSNNNNNNNNSYPTGRKGYLGNVVDRLHQLNSQQSSTSAAESLHQHQHQQQHDDGASGPLGLTIRGDDDDDQSANNGLSYHLQQFLAQQTSLDDLCSSVGLDDGNQLVLAAAIHRALVDSVETNGNAGAASGSTNPIDAKSTASSTASSSALSSVGLGSGLDAAGLSRRGLGAFAQRAHNTRAAGASLKHHLISSSSSGSGGGGGANSAALQLQRSRSGDSLNSLSNRAQQQRHAQAAAALSALASAGSHYPGQQQQHPQHHQHHHQHHHHANGLSQALAAAAAAAANTSTPNGTNTGGAGNATSNSGLGNPMVDFECDTCGSSFDDRHRLMQHQSIHLELKKDWFNETPVDEVMKIFNRRRGEFLCNTCNLRFEATFDYDKHNHQVHGQRPYCCQFCGNGTRTFRFWRQYLNHLYDHRYIFSCTIDDCDFTVNRRDSLRFHIFRFHLNCHLPQQQQHIRSAHHLGADLGGNKGQNNLLLNDSKWPTMDDDEDVDDEMSVAE